MPSVTYSSSKEVPSSVVVGSGSYTIPAGFYAVVTAQVHAGETFTINSTTVLTSSDVNDTWSTMISNASPLTSVSNGARVLNTNAPTGVSTADAFANSTARARARTSENGTYRLPAGATISGGRYCAQLFSL